MQVVTSKKLLSKALSFNVSLELKGERSDLTRNGVSSRSKNHSYLDGVNGDIMMLPSIKVLLNSTPLIFLLLRQLLSKFK